jgi:hypothetical protein
MVRESYEYIDDLFPNCYKVKISCTNCKTIHTMHIPYSLRVKDYIQDEECGYCKCKLRRKKNDKNNNRT